MTTNSKSLNLLQSLTCGICQNLFKDPNTLIPCGHAFCLDCLITNSSIKNCVQCKVEYTTYIPNHPLKQMIDCLDQSSGNNNNNNNETINNNINNNNNNNNDRNSLNGSNSNSIIGFIEGLSDSGGRRFSQQDGGLRYSSGGGLLENGSNSNIRYCVEHYEHYYAFCSDCQAPVCPRCLLTTHNRHGMIPLTKDSIATKMKEYGEIVESFKTKMSQYNDNISIYQKEIQLLDSTFLQCKQAIQLMISNLHKVLKTRETYLLKEIGNIHFASHLEISERSKTLENEINEMEKLIGNGTDKFKDATEILNNQNLKFEFLEQFHHSRTQSKKNLNQDGLKPLFKTDLLFYKANNDRITEMINNNLGNISLLTFPLDDIGEVNIWDEPKENIFIEKVRTNSNGVEEFEVKYGSLNKLIERLCLPNCYDDNYVNIFLLTYHSFCSSKKLLKKLIERFTIPEDLEAYGLTQASIHEIHMKIRNVLIKWITEYSPKFDQDTIHLFQNFNGRMQSEYTSIQEIENLLMGSNENSPSITSSQSLSSQSLYLQQTQQQQQQQQTSNNFQSNLQINQSLSSNINNVTLSNLNSSNLTNNGTCKIQNSPPQNYSSIFNGPSSSSSSSPSSPILNLNSLALINGNDNLVFESPLNSPRSSTSINYNNNSPRSSSFGASSASKFNNTLNINSGGGVGSSIYFPSPSSPTANNIPNINHFSSKVLSSSKNLEFNDIDELEIAKQLTLIDFENFRRIKPIDLLTCVDLKHKTPHITNIMDRFNNVSTWVSTTIVRGENLKNRVKIMNKFIKIAEHLKNLNNFNSLTAILVAIQRSTVTRKELVKQSVKIITDLEKLMSSDDSYSTYRNRLAQCSPPCVPYISIYLQDIMDLEKKNPSNIIVQISPSKTQEFINFTRRSLISKVILDLSSYQRFAYSTILPISNIQEYLEEL
ncbi:hypothetical protein RB653_009273 [Dictyostelium firmibasis]|uniref:Ras guanine nucleotide exchange factor n=1 Tax=Dictyostelium firmibasis TaxID=79012 RepID=A0AAN7YQ01_9MYCE